MDASQVIDALGGSTKFGLACGFTVNAAARGSDMKQRNSIPPAYWPRIVQAARKAGRPEITLDALKAMRAARISKRPSPSNSEARESV